MEYTDFEKRVYNLFLARTRINQDKPYSLRKDFSKLSEEKGLVLKKLSRFLEKHSHLMCSEFFDAPFKVFPDKNYFDLKFYASPKSIGAYSKYVKDQQNMDPDDQIEQIKKSYLFIYKFCIEKGISLREYPFYKSVALEDCLRHIKEHSVSMYTVFSFPELYTVVVNLDSDIYHLFFGDLDLQEFQSKFNRSESAKELSLKIKKEVSLRIDKKLAETS